MRPVPSELTAKLMSAAEVAAAEAASPGLDVSMDDIARSSGVPRATLYYYFSGKDDLISFYVAEMMRRMKTAVAENLAIEGTPAARLERLMRAVMHTFAGYPRMCVEMSAALRHLQDYGAVTAEMQQGVLAPTVAVLEEGNASGDFDVPDPSAAAVAMFGGMHMLASMDIITTGRLDADARADTMIPLMLRAIGARDRTLVH